MIPHRTILAVLLLVGAAGAQVTERYGLERAPLVLMDGEPFGV